MGQAGEHVPYTLAQVDGSLAGFQVEREWSPSYSASPRDPATLLPKKS